MKNGVFFLVLLFLFSCSDPSQKKSNTQSLVKITTDYGEMYFTLSDSTPNHKAMFVRLAEEKHYDQFTFNRVIEDFVIQGGCPDSLEFFKDSPYLLEPEFRDSLIHRYGALGMGRDDNPDKLSNGCQFYIVTNPNGLPRLDGKYMIFGQMIKGFDVLEKIERVETDSTDTPIQQISLAVSIVQDYNS